MRTARNVAINPASIGRRMYAVFYKEPHGFVTWRLFEEGGDAWNFAADNAGSMPINDLWSADMLQGGARLWGAMQEP